MDPDEVKKRFLYHAPTEETRAVHDAWRNAMLSFADELAKLGPSREISLAMTAFEESSFWVHAHIARNMQ